MSGVSSGNASCLGLLNTDMLALAIVVCTQREHVHRAGRDAVRDVGGTVGEAGVGVCDLLDCWR